MPDTPDVDALVRELNDIELEMMMEYDSLLSTVPDAGLMQRLADRFADWRERRATLVTTLATLARDATTANARADEAEAVCEWLAEEVAALNSGTVVIYSDGSVMRTAQQWLAAARNAVRETVRDE